MSSAQLTLLGQAESALVWPEHMKVLRISGDNMTPLLREGDFVAVDMSERSIHDGVYALQLGEEIVIRRLQPNPLTGTTRCIHDNQAYGSEETATEELRGRIVGRVVFAEKRID